MVLPCQFCCPEKEAGHTLPRKEMYRVVPDIEQLLTLAQQWWPTVTKRQCGDVVPSPSLEQNGMPASILPADEWRIIYCSSLSWPTAQFGLFCVFSPFHMQYRRCSSCTAFSYHHGGKLRKVSMLFLMSFICSIFPFCLVPISAFLHISFSFTVLFVMSHKYNLDSVSNSFSRLCSLLGTKQDWPEQQRGWGFQRRRALISYEPLQVSHVKNT